jgi:hypothetical protein
MGALDKVLDIVGMTRRLFGLAKRLKHHVIPLFFAASSGKRLLASSSSDVLGGSAPFAMDDALSCAPRLPNVWEQFPNLGTAAFD